MPPERYPKVELANHLLAKIGQLLLELQKLSTDTGKAHYLDIYPVDPEHPVDYTFQHTEQDLSR